MQSGSIVCLRNACTGGLNMTHRQAAAQRMTWSHRLIVLTGVLLCFGPAAIVFSCPGLFYAPVCSYLGVATAELTLYMTIIYLTMMALAPLMGSALERFDVRIVSTVCAISVATGILLMSTYTQVWQWWLSGILIGFGEICNLWLLVPVLVNRWFKEKAGFCIGLCMAFTGIGGVVFNLVGQAIIGPDLSNWRMTYLVFGIAAFVLSVPFTTLCIRSFPEDKGLLPYGATASSYENIEGRAKPHLTGLTAHQAMRTPFFYTICLCGGLFNIVAIMAQFFPKYVVFLSTDNFGAPIAALLGLTGTLESFTMAGQASGKVVVGAIESRTLKGALMFSCFCGIVGITACWQSATLASLPVLFGGGLIFGFFYASVTVVMPYLVRVVFGMKDYDRIYSRVQVVVNLCGAFAAVMWAWVADNLGFPIVFILGLCLIVCIVVLSLYSLRAGLAAHRSPVVPERGVFDRVESGGAAAAFEEQ